MTIYSHLALLGSYDILYEYSHGRRLAGWRRRYGGQGRPKAPRPAQSVSGTVSQGRTQSGTQPKRLAATAA